MAKEELTKINSDQDRNTKQIFQFIYIKAKKKYFQINLIFFHSKPSYMYALRRG